MVVPRSARLYPSIGKSVHPQSESGTNRALTLVSSTQPPRTLSLSFADAPSIIYRELMFTRPLRGYDLETQGEILNNISKAVEQGLLKSIVWKKEVLSVSSLREMHALQESGQAMGKIAFEVNDTIE
jgi:NADPH:quinone reductase-like Zn-dependent oxidoreductase